MVPKVAILDLCGLVGGAPGLTAGVRWLPSEIDGDLGDSLPGMLFLQPFLSKHVVVHNVSDAKVILRKDKIYHSSHIEEYVAVLVFCVY